jgi:hypothetical protein
VFRLVFASLITFGLLTGMVAGVIRAAVVSSGDVNLGLAINLTIAINLAIWLISPRLSDVTLRWFNKLIFLDDADAAPGWAHSGAARRLAAGTGDGGPRHARDASPPLPIWHAERRDRDGADERSKRLAGQGPHSGRGPCSGKSCYAFSSSVGRQFSYWLAADRMTVFGRGHGVLSGLQGGSATKRIQPSHRRGFKLTAEEQSSGAKAC